jgi:hypothetical protein
MVDADHSTGRSREINMMSLFTVELQFAKPL